MGDDIVVDSIVDAFVDHAVGNSLKQKHRLRDKKSSKTIKSYKQENSLKCLPKI